MSILAVSLNSSPGLRLGQRHQLFHVVGGDAGRHHQHFRNLGDQRDGLQVLERVVGDLFHARADGERAGADDADGAAVRRRFGDDVGAEYAALAGAVVDDDGLLENFRHALADDAGDDVVGAARRERHDQPNGLVRIILRHGGGRAQQGERDQQRL